MKEVQKLCNSVLPNLKGGPDWSCSKLSGHSGKHDSRDGGGTWSDAGAERLAEEKRKQFEAEPF